MLLIKTDLNILFLGYFTCHNGGTCNEAAVSCTCPRGYKGPQCEETQTPCESGLFECLNGGECNDNAGGLPYCTCKPGYLGETCGIPGKICDGIVNAFYSI